ncbi:UDP-N-acetylglucosamine 1-carboxyvinyltransferase [candidate division WOR-3 bacterium]|nr:UDP-N-acetylglucosamine 1-carboxyvinyltransferase [candidate division WOR-3 bacterium]
MDKLVIYGGNRLKGVVEVSGAKNSALPIMAATLLKEGKFKIDNIPLVRDIYTMAEVLEALGAKIQFNEHSVLIDTTGAVGHEAPYELVKKMRASYYVLGPLIARLKRARVSLPGGCAIGARPVDLHLKGLKALSVNVSIVHGYIEASTKSLTGSEVFLEGVKGPSVGATINTMMAATLAKGKTIIEGAAMEPEVVDVANFLKKIGAKISGHGTRRIEIKGVKKLDADIEYRIIPDRIEAGTYAVAAAITEGDVLIKGAKESHMKAIIKKLRETGAEVDAQGDKLRVKSRKPLKATDVRVAPFPGFPTDMQAQFMALLCIADGVSVVNESIFENRFMHVPELMRMGADLTIDGQSVIIRGKNMLSGAPVMASDLRASAALVLAGLVAAGKTEISRVYHLDRGYEKMEKKLKRLGADIWRIRE